MSAPVLEQLDDERRFQLLVEAVTGYALYLLDPDGNILSWNAGAEHITGYPRGEVIGRNFSILFTEEDRAANLPMQALRTAIDRGKYAADGWCLRKDSARFYSNTVIAPIRAQTGKFVGYAGATSDISQQRAAQQKLEQAREQIFQAQKVEAIGQLTGGIAHDFNNLLTVIVGGADLAELYTHGNEKLKRLITNVRQAALRAKSLTKQLLAFSQRDPLKPEIVDLSHQLGTVVDLLSRSLRGDIQIVAEVPPDLWPVMVDASQLQLALLNIGLNARDAMPNGGALSIRARNLGGEAGEKNAADRYVVVDINDNGGGMSEETKARAFEPFFTTKEGGPGSGFGLSQAHSFAKHSGGKLTLESVVGQGTKVSLHLPAASSIEQAENKLAAIMPVRANATILLVEGDPADSELAAELLAGTGYKVLTAPSARAALDMLRGGNQIDLVFSDVMMPGGMNGVELARVVRKEFPAVFILLAAADAGDISTEEYSLITKPYDGNALLDRLAEILGDVA
jgi:PAS domain S-box-containing protein